MSWSGMPLRLRVAAFSFLLPLPALLAIPHSSSPPGERLVALAQLPANGLGAESSVADVLALGPGEAVDGEPAASMTRLGGGIRPAVARPTAIAANGIPAAALRAYRAAEATMNIADPSCQLSWGLLAGIGHVESDHGRFGGAVVDENGVSAPRIVGVPLNGIGPVAAIADTDDGALDGDRRWDRAVGPMQFIPSTWSAAGVDGDSDGNRNPHDLDDAALAAAAYLCVGSFDLSTTYGQQHAVFGYNHSDDYVGLVLRAAGTYESGLVDLPALTANPLLGPEPDGTTRLETGQGVRADGNDKPSKKTQGKRDEHRDKSAEDAPKRKEAHENKRPAGEAERGKRKHGPGRPTAPRDRRTDDTPSREGKPKRDPDPAGTGTAPVEDGTKGGQPKPPKPSNTPKLQEFTGSVVTCGADICLDTYTLSGPDSYEGLVGQVVTVLAVLDGETLLVEEVVQQSAAAPAEPAS